MVAEMTEKQTGGNSSMKAAVTYENGEATCDHHGHEEHGEHDCGHGGCHN